MAYHFQNLVFEGGGVKGIAYVGILQVLSAKGILPKIRRVGGTSAGAINAALLALGYSEAEQSQILRTMDFNKFMDDGWGFLGDATRLVRDFGWYKGDFFRKWAGELVAAKLGREDANFADLMAIGRPELYMIGTNLSTGFGEVFSFEHSPQMAIADALRISMSIPLFFKAVRGNRGDIYVDGGVLDNYPVKLFDRMKYISNENQRANARVTDYYERENAVFLSKHPNSSPYVYNRETLGFRLDSKAEIGVFRDGQEPQHNSIGNFIGYMKALVGTLIDAQAMQHLHGDDWQRTVYIDTLGVSTVDFGLSEERKAQLVESGRNHAVAYFNWYDQNESVNKPVLEPKIRVS